MKKLIAIALLLTTTSLCAQTPTKILKQIEALDWMTEEYPPFNYVDKDGKLQGLTVDILIEVFKKSGVQLTRDDLNVLPWARSYQKLLDTPGTALFSMTYTEERLKHFQFVGPIIPTQVSIIARVAKQLKVADTTDLKTLKIGVIRDDIGDQLVRAFGAEDKNLNINHSAFNMVQMLAKGRLHAIAYAEDIAMYQFILAGMDPNEYESVHVLQKSHMGYAFHKSTDPQILEPLSKALEELRAAGVIDSIYARHLKQPMGTK